MHTAAFTKVCRSTLFSVQLRSILGSKSKDRLFHRCSPCLCSHASVRVCRRASTFSADNVRLQLIAVESCERRPDLLQNCFRSASSLLSSPSQEFVASVIPSSPWPTEMEPWSPCRSASDLLRLSHLRLVRSSWRWSRGRPADLRQICFDAPIFAVPNFACSGVRRPLMKQGEVHVWCLFPKEIHDSKLQSYKSIISHDERIHLSEMASHKAKEFLLTRVLARTLLAKYAGEAVDPNHLKFEKNRFGKPEVIWPVTAVAEYSWNSPNISFNISHTESLIACVISSGFQVGLDVEKQDREIKTDLVRFARRKFSHLECVRLEQIPDLEMRKNHFLQLWTLKESYGKALGNGISGTMLRDIAFDFEEFRTSEISHHVTGIKSNQQVLLLKPEFLRSQHSSSDFLKFVLLEISGSHFGAICMHLNGSIEGFEHRMQTLHFQVMKTIPCVKDDPFQDACLLGFSI